MHNTWFCNLARYQSYFYMLCNDVQRTSQIMSCSRCQQSTPINPAKSCIQTHQVLDKCEISDECAKYVEIKDPCVTVLGHPKANQHGIYTWKSYPIGRIFQFINYTEVANDRFVCCSAGSLNMMSHDPGFK